MLLHIEYARQISFSAASPPSPHYNSTNDFFFFDTSKQTKDMNYTRKQNQFVLYVCP